MKNINQINVKIAELKELLDKNLPGEFEPMTASQEFWASRARTHLDILARDIVILNVELE